MKHGINYLENGKYEFNLWAPFLSKVALKIVSPQEKIIPMEKDGKGYWKITVGDTSDKTRYLYQLNGEKERPDPASHFQPEGVHGPSQVIDHDSFRWEDREWNGIPISAMIIYELHTGTFTAEGTFEAIIPRLDKLKDMGINVLEIMPIAQFPGERNWGYDGVYPFAVQNSYGGPTGFKWLVNECHKRGIAVILDVVYNHLGPEGNYLWDYGPYFTKKYRTPWGDALNFDGAHSNEVRNYFIENALHWFKNYHIDALRLDAIHGISDMSAKPFLSELAEKVEEFSKTTRKTCYLIAESDLNDSKVTRPREFGGYGIDAQWCDDFHHALHTILTEEKQGYYSDFGEVKHLVKAMREGFVYSGEYSQFRQKNHGNSSKDVPATQFVTFSQNHDQIGNRVLGERLSVLVSFESLKLAAGAVILSPYVPLLFMGEEYGEDAPFLYFVSHSDPALIEAVRQGRKAEFRNFSWKEEPPDPQSVETFLKSKMDWEKRNKDRHKVLMDFYKHLLSLRKTIPALSSLDKKNLTVNGLEGEKIIFMRRWKDSTHVFIIFNFNCSRVKIIPPVLDGGWEKMIDSSETIWNGPGSLLPKELNAGDEITIRGFGFVMYNKENR